MVRTPRRPVLAERYARGAQSLARSAGAALRTLPGQTHMLKPTVTAPVLAEFFA